MWAVQRLAGKDSNERAAPIRLCISHILLEGADTMVRIRSSVGLQHGYLITQHASFLVSCSVMYSTDHTLLTRLLVLAMSRGAQMLGEFIVLVWTFKVSWRRRNSASPAYGRSQALATLMLTNGMRCLHFLSVQCLNIISGVACFM